VNEMMYRELLGVDHIGQALRAEHVHVERDRRMRALSLLRTLFR
jgi:hypothetical protein